LEAECVEVVHKGHPKLVVRTYRATHSEEHDQKAADRQQRRDRRIHHKERNRELCMTGHTVSTESSARAPSEVARPEDAPRRLRRAEAILRRRTSRLVLVLERSCDIHNHSAVLRTAECLGIQHVYIVDPVEFRSTGSKKISRQSTEWIDVKHFTTPSACIHALKAEGWTIWATDLSPTAVSIEDGALEIPERLALVIGREADGVSPEMLDAADRRVYFPLHGWSDSLNLSVAAAVILSRLFWMDPSLRGAMSSEERAQLRRRWFAKLARTDDQRRVFPLWVDTPPPPTSDCRKDEDQRTPHVRPRIVRRTRAKELELEAKASAEEKESMGGAGADV